jgi:hypothetical protein
VESLDFASSILARSHTARLQAEALVARSRRREGVAASPVAYSAMAIDRARGVRAEARVVRSRSVATRVRTLRTQNATLAARLISGSSEADGPQVISTIAGVFLCDRCIARKTGVAEDDVSGMLARLGKTLKITSETGRCDGCLRADLLRRFE